jgi:hypothetical protein
MVVDHRLRPQDPLAAGEDDTAAADALLDPAPVPLDRAAGLIVA